MEQLHQNQVHWLSNVLKRLYLTDKETMKQVTADLLGLQAQFNANPYYSLKIRSKDYNEIKVVEDYVKTWSFRGTIHLVHKDDLNLHLSARGHTDWSDYWGMKATEKQSWADFILSEIKAGKTTRNQLKESCLHQNLSEEHFSAVFHGWGGLLQEMCLQGIIAYQPTNKKEFIILDPVTFIDQSEARAEVIKQYFATYGPATLNDCAYFTSYKITEIKGLIEKFQIELNRLEIEKKTYYYLGELLSGVEVPEIILLAGFDPLILGYKDKSRFIDETLRYKYVTNTGIIFPGILINGKLGARWQKNRNTIIVKPYQKLLVRQKKEITKQLLTVFPELSIEFESSIL